MMTDKEREVAAELANKLQLIEDLAVLWITPHTLTDEQLYKVYKKIGEVKNKHDNRSVIFVNSVFGKITRHKGVDTRQIIPQLGNIFELSLLVYSEPHEEREGHKNHPNLIGYHNYLSKIEVNGSKYYVRLTVQEERTLQKNRTPHQLHSTFISDVAMYSIDVQKNAYNLTKDVGEHSAASFPRLLTGASADRTYFDAKLQHFFEKAREAKEKLSTSV